MEMDLSEKSSHNPDGKAPMLEKLRPASGSYSAVESIRPADYYRQIVETPNKTERILSALVDFIHDAGLKDGDRLPPEKQLCEIFGVGTRSLREALIGLRTLGLVQSQQGTGWYVKQFNPAISLQFLSAVIKNFSRADLQEIMTTRLANEPVITAMAAEKISEEGLAKLKQALTVMQQTASDLEFRFHDRKFHDILAQECGNSIMAMISSILTGLFYAGQLLPKHGDHLRILQQHQAIFDAVRSHSPENAEKAMTTHLRLSRDFVNTQLRSDPRNRADQTV